MLQLFFRLLSTTSSVFCLRLLGRHAHFHERHVRQVLKHLLENRLFGKAEKCEFHVSTVSFLGYIIERGNLKADPAKVDAVLNWPVPVNRKQLQSFLGFANFFRRFIRDYSKIAAPLTCLTSPFCGMGQLRRPSHN